MYNNTSLIETMRYGRLQNNDKYSLHYDMSDPVYDPDDDDYYTIGRAKVYVDGHVALDWRYLISSDDDDPQLDTLPDDIADMDTMLDLRWWSQYGTWHIDAAEVTTYFKSKEVGVDYFYNGFGGVMLPTGVLYTGVFPAEQIIERCKTMYTQYVIPEEAYYRNHPGVIGLAMLTADTPRDTVSHVHIGAVHYPIDAFYSIYWHASSLVHRAEQELSLREVYYAIAAGLANRHGTGFTVRIDDAVIHCNSYGVVD